MRINQVPAFSKRQGWYGEAEAVGQQYADSCDSGCRDRGTGSCFFLWHSPFCATIDYLFNLIRSPSIDKGFSREQPHYRPRCGNCYHKRYYYNAPCHIYQDPYTDGMLEELMKPIIRQGKPLVIVLDNTRYRPCRPLKCLLQISAYIYYFYLFIHLSYILLNGYGFMKKILFLIQYSNFCRGIQDEMNTYPHSF